MRAAHADGYRIARLGDPAHVADIEAQRHGAVGVDVVKDGGIFAVHLEAAGLVGGDPVEHHAEAGGQGGVVG